MHIDFLQHSGFACSVEEGVFVFDYWQDPLRRMDTYFGEGRPLWFFVTHIHGDHFSPTIAHFDREDTVYILHKDIGPFSVPKGRVFFMDVDDEIIVDGVTIHMYGSTDAGGSFLVTTPSRTIFHAGDLNWWHWLGDTEENNREARQFFDRELARIDGMEADIAFFPVDARLEGAREWGLLEWLDHVKVHKLLIPMHMHDLEEGGWHPSGVFLRAHGDLPLWIPKSNGERREFHV